MDRMKGKVALVTGAGRGIGRACAQLLAREGARVVVTDLDDEPGRETAETIGEALFLHHDVRSEADWRRVVDAARERFGRIDALVNDAGIYLIKDTAETSLEELHEIFRTNVDGVFLGMKLVAPIMAERGGGSIVNLSSMDGIVGSEGHAAYGASKAAVRVMTKCTALELAKKKVRVNSVHPGYIHTRMAEYGAKQYGETLEELGEEFPVGHIGEPMDVAWGVLYLASDESKFVTGSELVIDGGATSS